MIPAAQALTAELDAEVAATRRLLDRVPADRLEWRPHQKSMTLGQLAFHVAAIPGAITDMSRLDGLDATTVDFTPPQPESRETLLATLDESTATARRNLAELDEAAAAGSWRLSAGEREIFTLPRLALLRSLAFNHWYHHRGQLTVYLRLLDVPLPATYGPSADEGTMAVPG
jgi:uncharacterized damage-inducible protein DinB